MSAICERRWMLVHAAGKSSFFGPMSLDPTLIREKLFQGIDGDYNVTNMDIVVEVIGELENFHITKEALEATRLGKHINELRRKAADKNLANRAKSLVKKWRSLFSAAAGGDTAGPPPGGGGNNNSLAATNGNTVAARLSHPAAAVLSPGLRSNSISPGLPPPQQQQQHRGNLISPGLPTHQQQQHRSIISPGLPPQQQFHHQQRSVISPGLPPLRSTTTSSAMSPSLPRPHSNQSSSSTISPGLPSSSVRCAIGGGGGVIMTAAAMAIAASNNGRRSARPSPSVSRSATPRVSPATVTLSSSGSSPSNSRPSSPSAVVSFRPLNVGGGEITPMTTSLPNSRSPSPEIEIIEEVVVNTPRLVINNKRMRRDDNDDSDDVKVVGEAASKRPRLDFQNQNHKQQQHHHVNGVGGGGGKKDGKMRDGVILSKSDSSSPSSKKVAALHSNSSSPQWRKGGGGLPTSSSNSNHKQQPQHSMLNKQISLAQRAGKVKTTRELVENLGIETSAVPSRQSSLSPPAAGGGGPSATINSLVPSENKEELMKRFFESQQQRGGSPAEPSVASRPGSVAAAASGHLTSSSATVSQASSRAATPAVTIGKISTTVEDILAALPPIEDPAAVLAEWAALAEEEEEIDGLIPVYRPPKLEVSDDVVAALNGDVDDSDDRRRLMEHVGGVTDYAGVFKEWHEMVAKSRDVVAVKDEEGAAAPANLLHILPYSIIE